jgi:hypothetical protein
VPNAFLSARYFSAHARAGGHPEIADTDSVSRLLVLGSCDTVPATGATMSRSRAIFYVLIATQVPLSVSPAASTELKTPLQTCTIGDCGATVLRGQINRTDRCCGFFGLAVPFVTQVYAGKNECLRLHVANQAALNTVMVAVAPGTRRAWRGDVLKIKTNDNEEGWFTVQVSQATGTATNGEFVLKYSRYAAANPNCASATPPLPSNF